MPGAVAAGDRETARAGVEILRRGGNAVDAAIAATAASFVTEPLLSSAGGSGVSTVAIPGQEPVSIDFFSDMPGLGLTERPDPLDFHGVHVDFGPVKQQFHVGRGSAAVPGVLPGLAQMHRTFGSLPLSDLMAPAIRLATEGVIVQPNSAHVYGLLWRILTWDPETTRALSNGTQPRVGERIRNPDLAGVLHEFAVEGKTPARMVDAMLEHFGPHRGGLLTGRDIAEMRAVVTTPRAVQRAGWTAYFARTLGGRAALRIYEALAEGIPEFDIPDEYLRIARASGAGHEDRNRAITRGSTTHISVVDAQGGVAAITVTNGEGSGYTIPGTGIQMNNFLGEEDINPLGFHMYPAGERITTMMAPTVGRHQSGSSVALGSGGSNRIRTAVGVTAYRAMVLRQPLEAAVRAPRVHAEGETVWVECEDPAERDGVVHALYRGFLDVHAFDRRDFFFGGVNAVAMDVDGRAHGIGDPRRGGECMVSE